MDYKETKKFFVPTFSDANDSAYAGVILRLGRRNIEIILEMMDRVNELRTIEHFGGITSVTVNAALERVKFTPETFCIDADGMIELSELFEPFAEPKAETVSATLHVEKRGVFWSLKGESGGKHFPDEHLETGYVSADVLRGLL